MKSDRLYPFLVVLLILLLIGSAVLATMLFRMLGSSTTDDLSGGGSGDSAAFGRSRLGGWRLGGGAGDSAPGLAGTHDKWALHAPARASQGQPSELTGAANTPGGFVPDPGFFGMPVMFEEDCHDFGGEYSLLSPGADLSTFLTPGMLCLDVQRPEIDVPEQEKRHYTVDGIQYDACNLERTARLCVDIGKVRPQSARRSWDPLYGPTPVQDPDESALLETWHSPFAGPFAGRPHAADGPGDGDWMAPSPPDRPQSSRQYNYLNNNPQQWFTDLPASASATMLDFQPGVDASVYADQNRLEYVFVFWPETEPIDVEFSYQDARSVRELGSDNLAIDYECATLLQHRPFAYTWYDGRPYETPAYYTVAGRTVRLQFTDRYEPPHLPTRRTETVGGNAPENYPPVTDYVSFLGGTGTEQAYAVAVDNNGYAYAVGATTSREFGPGTAGEAAGTSRDAFVTKFRVSDRKIIYTTMIGGRHDDLAYGVVASADGSVYVCGETISPDFATVTEPPGGVIGRGWDAFVVKLDPEGRIDDFACRVGGRGDDRAYGIALDAEQNLYLAGVTHSEDFPVTEGTADSGPGGGADAFLMKLAPDGDLVFSMRLGGSGDDQAYGLAIGPDMAPVLVGQTASRDFPVVLAEQPDLAAGGTDAFITKVSADGSRLAFSTFLGGSNDDRALAVDVDLAGGIWIAGETASTNFPTLKPHQAGFAGGSWDAFFCRLPAEGSPLLRSTYLGGSGDDRAFGIAVEASGRAHLAGTTSSTNLPMVQPFQDTFGGGGWDAFAAGFSESGDTVRYVTYLGGSSNDAIHALAIEAGRMVHLAGATDSRDLNLVSPLQTTHRGADDALVGRLLTDYPRTPPLRLVPAGGMPNGPFYDYYLGTYEVTNEEFAHFLNDAQANPDSARGTNMFFDAFGNVWMNPETVRERDELFSIYDSRLVYAAHFPIGARYSVTPRPARDGGSYARHPIVGISWFGAVKYCNWLTVETGRGEAHRCYREGIRPLDWAPVTCSPAQWAAGQFSSPERFEWLRFRGFRLPMDNSASAPDAALQFLVSHDEFADFLNDTQANPDSLRGTNMVFDSDGNVSFNAEDPEQVTRLFTIKDTWLTYTEEAPRGRRYTVVETPAGTEPPPYQDSAISNVTWYGAMKYCNWITLLDGIEPGERSYREGSRAEDWAPATASREGWPRGEFTEDERRYWLQLKGTRLPFVSDVIRGHTPEAVPERLTATNSWPNAFNEVLKAASWVVGTNTAFGFGRDGFDFQDANYLDSGMFAKHDTTPVGFYDGSDHEGRSLTRTNENLFGLYDLGGNASEWTSDFGLIGTSIDRAYHGGSWRFPLPRARDRAYVHPYFTENFMGFRVATVSSSEKMCVLRIPFRLCICGYGMGAGCGRGEGEGEGEKAKDNTISRGDGDDGLKEFKDGRGVITTDDDDDDDDEDDDGGGGGGGGGEGGGGGPEEPEESPSDDGG